MIGAHKRTLLYGPDAYRDPPRQSLGPCKKHGGMANVTLLSGGRVVCEPCRDEGKMTIVRMEEANGF